MICPMRSRGNALASNPHSGHRRSRTHVQFLVSGVIATFETLTLAGATVSGFPDTTPMPHSRSKAATARASSPVIVGSDLPTRARSPTFLLFVFTFTRGLGASVLQIGRSAPERTPRAICRECVAAQLDHRPEISVVHDCNDRRDDRHSERNGERDDRAARSDRAPDSEEDSA